jgi:hypothetical protein
VLTKLAQSHAVTVSAMCSDHPTFTAGGSLSLHYLGRGMDIAAIDGVSGHPHQPDRPRRCGRSRVARPQLSARRDRNPICHRRPGVLHGRQHARQAPHRLRAADRPRLDAPDHLGHSVKHSEPVGEYRAP